MYKKGGKKKRESWMEESKEVHFGNKPSKKKTGGLYSAAEVSENIKRVKETNAEKDVAHHTQVKKQMGGPAVDRYGNTATSTRKTGGKSMEPGGGGRFAKLVGKLKSKGKSAESAKAIAASIGRKKYGKSRFQQMAAKGKKGLGGASDSTGANEAGMEMMENMGPKKPKRGSSGTHDTGPNVRRTRKARRNIGKCSRGEVCFD